jgi:aspartate kinase
VRAGIPIIISSTFDPEKGSTCITVDSNTQLPLIRAIAMRHSQILITIKNLKRLSAHVLLSNILSILAKHKISIDLITTSDISAAFTMDHSANVSANKELITLLEDFSDITLEDSLTLIAIIGAKLISPEIIHKIFDKIDDNFIRVIYYGASSSSVGILVHDHDAHEIAKILHRELIEKEKRY